ncbi:hypothetical protein RHSIM_Rhsim08G0238700 [Rhododendron simsii]|uniref:Uncharacterized protein n=1 Tax=Rhododendron simsii TaxID=118357 RepID=A0A834GKF2_RHOSS|nr:hypothetical protein RHSIM_Rhsim08G0238700 [Rhododendron simsii]
MAPTKEGPELREKIKKILHKALDKLIEAIWNAVEEEVIAEEEVMAADGGSIEAIVPIEDAEKRTEGDDWCVDEEDEEMVEIEEIDLMICKITTNFEPERLTKIEMNGIKSYEHLASRIHLAWSERSHEEFYDVVPDITESWPEGYIEFLNADGKKLDPSLPWSQFKKELHHIVVGLFE